MDEIETKGNDTGQEDKIIEKWKKLQEIILKEKSLIDVLFNYKNNDYSDIKKLIIDYSETKLKIRQIKDKKKGKNKEKKLQIDTKINIFNHTYINIYKDIQKLLFFLRKNIDYILKIILSINENDKPKIESLVEFICNQFYDDLPPKNNKHKQIMIIIYTLIEREISNMDCAMVDNFLHTNIFLNKLLTSFCNKEEFTEYLSKLLNPLLSSVEKEIEDNDMLNLSLFEIGDIIKNKNNNNKKNNNYQNEDNNVFNKSFSADMEVKKSSKSNNKLKRKYSINKDKDNNQKENDNKNLNKNLWRNCSEFIDDLTQKKLYNMIKEEKNNYNKELYRLQFERSFNNQSNEDENIFNNDKFIELLNHDSFNDNVESIINKYKQNYLFIHQKIDIFLLGLINDIKLIPNNIRYICKIIYVLISKKFPDLPKYIKNSFVGKFFFEQYIFPGLIMENKLIFENKVISFEAKKCCGEIISILSHANKCLLFNNNDDTEKAIYNNYLLQIIPILDKFYNALIDVKLPKIIDKLINLKLEEFESKTHRNKFSRRKKPFEGSNNLNVNLFNNSSIYQIIKDNKKSKKKKFNIEDSLWNLQYICFSINDLLYILSLINKKQNMFINLPKNEKFYSLFQSIMAKQSILEKIVEENNNVKKFYIVYNSPINILFEELKNYRNKNFLLFSKNAINNSNELSLNIIKYSIKMLLQEIDIINKRRYNLLNIAFSNEKFLKYLYYLSLEILQYDANIMETCDKNKLPIFLYGRYLIDNLNNLEKKYSENDYKELYNIIYNEELSNLNKLNQYWDIIITRNDEKIKLADKIINKLKLYLEYLQNSLTIDKAEKIIFLTKMDVYVRVDVKNRSETNPPIIVEEKQIETKKKEEQATLINNIEEFINIFSENSLICDPKLKIKPYELMILDIYDGKNENLIYESIIKYLDIIKLKLKTIYPEMREKEKNKIIELVKDYILKSIYKLVFPKASLKEDTSFYKHTQLLDWITPENFAIKNIDFAQLTFAESLIKKFEDSKSIDEKIRYICDMHAYINNIFKFNTGKDVEIGQDELTPVLQYLLIKIQPRRIISNINYVKCFLNDEDQISQKGFLISQIDTAVSYIHTIQYDHLNVSETEFNKNIEKSRKKNNL